MFFSRQVSLTLTESVTWSTDQLVVRRGQINSERGEGGGLFVAHKIAKNIIQDQHLALDNSHVYKSCTDLDFTLRQIFILVDCITRAFCSHLSLAKRSCSARATPATHVVVADQKRGLAGLV